MNVFICSNICTFILGMRASEEDKEICTITYLSVKAGVLTHITDVDRQPGGCHQLSDAVIDQPVRAGELLHTDLVKETHRKVRRPSEQMVPGAANVLHLY